MIYIVKTNDTLSRIAKEHLGDVSRWPEIARLNNIDNPNLIYPGTKLKLPPRKESAEPEGFFARLRRLWSSNG